MRYVDPAERHALQRDLAKMQRQFSPRIQSPARFSIMPRWKVVADKHGERHRIEVFDVFAIDDTRDHGKQAIPEFLGEFPFLGEAQAFVKGAEKGKVSIAIGCGPFRTRLQFDRKPIR